MKQKSIKQHKALTSKPSLRMILFSALMLIILFCAFELYTSKHWLTVSHYEITSDKVEHDFRIVQLTDLHNSVFGKENEKLME